MLTELFTSRTRIHLFLKLFLNPQISCYLRELAREFNLTPNALKEELDNLSRAGYLLKEQRGQYIFYQANTDHPFFPEISSIIKKYYGIDKIVEHVLTLQRYITHLLQCSKFPFPMREIRPMVLHLYP